MSKIYWHNATKEYYNETELSDFVADVSKSDLILYTVAGDALIYELYNTCLLYTSPSPRDKRQSRMPSSA